MRQTDGCSRYVICPITWNPPWFWTNNFDPDLTPVVLKEKIRPCTWMFDRNACFEELSSYEDFRELLPILPVVHGTQFLLRIAVSVASIDEVIADFLDALANKTTFFTFVRIPSPERVSEIHGIASQSCVESSAEWWMNFMNAHQSFHQEGHAPNCFVAPHGHSNADEGFPVSQLVLSPDSSRQIGRAEELEWDSSIHHRRE